ncbi:MAG: hypothetical protein KF774_19610, partial [Planctomyces sp.]|nr:hypothetical protein [Planctomyces sp.]
SGTPYLSVATGPESAAIVRVKSDGSVEAIALQGVGMARAELPDPPQDELQGPEGRRRNPRMESVTDLAFVDGQLLVSGRFGDQGRSGVQSIAYPFGEKVTLTGIEIFHAAHGRYEDNAAVRVFIPFNINGEPHVLAGFTCTPLVKFPVNQLDGSDKVRGTTVAELGNRNQPLDMVSYEKDGRTYLLMANSTRGMMKISTDNLERTDGLEDPVSGGGTAGQEFQKVEGMDNIRQLDKLDDSRAVVIDETEGELMLMTIPLP